MIFISSVPNLTNTNQWILKEEISDLNVILAPGLVVYIGDCYNSISLKMFKMFPGRVWFHSLGTQPAKSLKTHT